MVNFDGNIEDLSGDFNPISTGEITFLEEDGRSFARLSSESRIKFPAAFSQQVFANNSVQISFDFRIPDAEPILTDCCWGAFNFFTAKEFSNILDLQLVNFPGFGAEWNYSISDLEDEFTGGVFIIEDTMLETWRTFSIKYDLDKRRWTASLGNELRSGALSDDFDIENFKSELTSNQILIRGIEGLQANIDIDNLHINAPAETDNQAVVQAFQMLTGDLKGEMTVPATEKESLKEFLLQDLYFSDFSEISDALFAYTHAYEEENPPLYENGQVITFEGLPLFSQLLQFTQDYVLQTQFITGKVQDMEGVAFEHREVIPGLVEPDAERIQDASVMVDATYVRDIAAELTDQDFVVRPTGYFAVAGELITVKVPTEMVDKGLSIIVGAHFRNMDYEYLNDTNRFLDISTEYSLDTSEVIVANPLGGGIYVKVPEGTDLGDFAIHISNAIKAPYFSWKEGSKTEVADWLKEVEESGAPWADFESDKFMFTIPVGELEGVTNPDEIMIRWDEIMDAIRLVGGRPNERPRAEYYSFDTRLVTPAYGAGYPLVMSINEALEREFEQRWNPLNVLDHMPHPVLLHEMGHNHLQPTMAYGGDLDPCHNLEAETIVHMLGTSVYSNVYGLDINDAFQASGVGQKFGFDQAAFDWIVTHNFRTNERMYNDTSTVLEEGEMLRYQPRSWAKYAEIADLFGWDALSKVNGKFYHPGIEQSSSVCDWRPYVVGRDEYIQAATEAVGVNMTPLFHFWGINPSAELAEELHAYPQSPEIKARIISYRDNVAPKTLEDFMVYFNLFPKEDYHLPRYEEYLQEFDEEFAADIQAQFNFLLETYFPAPRTEAKILEFSVPGAVSDAVIDTLTKTVSVEVSMDSDLTSVVPSFVLSDGAIATVAGERQESSVSELDFTEPVTYLVKAEDQLTQEEWEVTLRLPPSSVEDIDAQYYVSVLPNPTKDECVLSFKNVPLSVVVFDLHGRQYLVNHITNQPNLVLDLPSPKGIYLIQVQWAEHMEFLKVVKQ